MSPDENDSLELKFLVSKTFMQSFESPSSLTAFLQTRFYDDGQVVGSMLYEDFGTLEHQVNFYQTNILLSEIKEDLNTIYTKPINQQV